MDGVRGNPGSYQNSVSFFDALENQRVELATLFHQALVVKTEIITEKNQITVKIEELNRQWETADLQIDQLRELQQKDNQLLSDPYHLSLYWQLSLARDKLSSEIKEALSKKGQLSIKLALHEIDLQGIDLRLKQVAQRRYGLSSFQ